MKILWVTGVKFGKTIHQWGQLGTADALQSRGIEVDFLSPIDSNNGTSILRDFSFGHTRLSGSRIPGLYFFSLNRNIVKLLTREINLSQYDAVISEWQTSLGVMRAYRKIRQMGKTAPPWIFEDRSPPATSSILSLVQWGQYRLSWKLAANSADSVEVLVPGLENFIRNKYDFKKRIIHCPSGADITRFTPEKSTSLNDPLRLVHHGSLDKGRGLERIIHLGVELEKHPIPFEITVFGSGPIQNLFEKESKRHDWLRFLGRIRFDEVPNEIRRHDIGILPLPKRLPWDVGSPLKAMEYAASGLCVLATDVDGSIPFRKFDWFFDAPHDDPIEHWINSITEIHDSPIDLRKKARLDAERELSWETATSDLYAELVRISKLGWK